MLNTIFSDTDFSNWIPIPTTIEEAVDRFAPISLKEIGGAALLNRVETKYVVSAEILPTLFNDLHADYRVLSIKGTRLNRYRTLYFDSADFSLYRRHHSGALDRYKVRSREYLETHKTFLEIKHKTNKKRTQKERQSTERFLKVIDPQRGDFIRDHYPFNVDELYGRLLTEYTRITLVSRHSAERVTIDLDLAFSWDGRRETLPHIAIIEVKRGKNSAESPAMRQLRHGHIRPNGFSKYCIGVSLVYPEVKHNNFKSKLRLINKLSQGASHDYRH